MLNNININIGSDGGNHHPLNITTCKEVTMSKNIYRSNKRRKFVEGLNNVFGIKNSLTDKQISKYFTKVNTIPLSYAELYKGENNHMYGVEPWNKGKKIGYCWNKGMTGYKNNYPKSRVSPKFDEERLNKHKQRMKLWWSERKAKL